MQNSACSSFPKAGVVVPPVVPERAAAEPVDDGEERDEGGVEQGDLLPYLLEVPQDAGLAALQDWQP